MSGTHFGARLMIAEASKTGPSATSSLPNSGSPPTLDLDSTIWCRELASLAQAPSKQSSKPHPASSRSVNLFILSVRRPCNRVSTARQAAHSRRFSHPAGIIERIPMVLLSFPLKLSLILNDLSEQQGPAIVTAAPLKGDQSPANSADTRRSDGRLTGTNRPKSMATAIDVGCSA